MDRIAARLREVSERLPAADREAAMVEVLRSELDSVPETEVYGVLARLRETVGGFDTAEIASLWKCLANLAAQAATRKAPEPAPEPSRAAPAGLSEAVLGKSHAKEAPVDAEAQKRLMELLARVMDVFDMAESEFQRTLQLWRKPIVPGRTGETLTGLKPKSSLRRLLVKAMQEGGDTTEVEKRIKLLGAAASLVYISYHQVVAQVSDALRELIDPQALEQNHGREAWAKYRQIYVNRLQRLGPEFQQEFFETRFLQEFFKRVRHL